MTRTFKTPNRRRLKKWRRRTERTIEGAKRRGFKWFFRHLLVTCKMQDAADATGSDLASKYAALENTPAYQSARATFMRFLMNYQPIPEFASDELDTFVDPWLGKEFGNETPVEDVVST